jgi:hypothetical protein
MKKVFGLILAASLMANANPILDSQTGNLYDYFVLNSNITFENAIADAAQLGDGWHLLTINSDEELAFVANSVLTTAQAPWGYAWIGGQQSTDNGGDLEAGWSWITGEDFYAYHPQWLAGEPNDLGDNIENNQENYLMLYDDPNRTRSGQLVDADKNYYYVNAYVVEHSASVPEPGIMLSLILGMGSLIGFLRFRRK